MIIRQQLAISKYLIFSSLTLTLLYGCATPKNVGTHVVREFNSPQEVITKKGLNANNGQAREYVYDWGAQAGNKAIEVASPKNYMSSYCQTREGKLTLIHPSQLYLVKESAAKRRLSESDAVQDSIGTFRCVQKVGLSWVVSIEPVFERKRSNSRDVRVVGLITKITTEAEAKKQPSISSVAPRQQEKSTVKEPQKPAVKAEPKVEAEEVKPEKPIEKVPEKAVETRQQLQQRLYSTARRDINRGANQLEACAQAERAYGLGRFYNASGPNIQVESGVLVAKCLTTVPAYSKKFVNANGRAKTILQGILKSQNHAVAKHMLQQLK